MSRILSEIEIVAIGDELLSGATIETNGAFIGRELETLGLRVVRKAIVRDSVAAIASAVEEALTRTGAVVTTGGLGPTADDLTKAAVAQLLRRQLVFREDLWEELKRRWARRGKIPETNRTQAEAPAGSIVFPNARGTAPGLAVEDDRYGLCILLPGPPHELRQIVVDHVVPYLSDRVGADALRPFRRYLRTAGIAESAIAEKVGQGLDDLPLEVAYLPEIDGNDIRLTGWATHRSEIAAALDEAERRLRSLLGLHIYAEGAKDLAEAVGDLLRERGSKMAVAESCTAGLIAKRLTEVAGSSDYFWGGVVAYDDGAKVELLGVTPHTLRVHGAVSEETAVEMVEGAVRLSGAESAIAVTGIAGPGGGTEDKPVGTVWLAVQFRDRRIVKRRHFPGTRDMVRARAAQGGLDLLRRAMLEETA